MTRDGAPASFYVPGQASANNYNFNVFGQTNSFPFSLAVQGGNPSLDSEEADTYTVGTVIRSPFDAAALQRLSLSIDYYNIDIKGAIAIPTHLTVYQQCLDAQYNSLIGDAPGAHTGAELAANNPYCQLIQREYLPAQQLTFGADRKFRAQYVNLGGIKTKGIDVQLDWAGRFADMGMASVPGMLTANIQYSHLDSYAQSPFEGGAFIEQKGTGVNFEYRIFTTLGYSNGPWSVGMRWQYWPSLAPRPAPLPTRWASALTARRTCSDAGRSTSATKCGRVSTTCSTPRRRWSARRSARRTRSPTTTHWARAFRRTTRSGAGSSWG